MDFGVEILDKCTLSQACEFIAFGFEPMLPMYEDLVGRHIARSEWKGLDDYSNDFNYNMYDSKMLDAKAKLKVALCQGILTAKGIPDFDNIIFDDSNFVAQAAFSGKKLVYDYNKLISDVFENRAIVTDITPDTELNIITNEIKTEPLLYMDIEIDFEELKPIFGKKTEELETPTTKYFLLLEDDTIYLKVGELIKINIKKLQSGAKNTQIINYIMSNPNKLITREDIKKLNINNFDDADRIDQFIINALKKPLYKLFFPTCTTNSVQFNPEITNLDLKNQDIDLLVV